MARRVNGKVISLSEAFLSIEGNPAIRHYREHMKMASL
jgi:hypothetical protein